MSILSESALLSLLRVSGWWWSLLLPLKNLLVSFKVGKSLYHLPYAACLPHCAWHNLVLSWFQALLLIFFPGWFQDSAGALYCIRKWCCHRTLGFLMYFGLFPSWHASTKPDIPGTLTLLLGLFTSGDWACAWSRRTPDVWSGFTRVLC